jgi:hypothetical protein
MSLVSCHLIGEIENGNKTENEKTESATFGGDAAPTSRSLDDSCSSKVGGIGGSQGCQR